MPSLHSPMRLQLTRHMADVLHGLSWRGRYHHGRRPICIKPRDHITKVESSAPDSNTVTGYSSHFGAVDQRHT